MEGTEEWTHKLWCSHNEMQQYEYNSNSAREKSKFQMICTVWHTYK